MRLRCGVSSDRRRSDLLVRCRGRDAQIIFHGCRQKNYIIILLYTLKIIFMNSKPVLRLLSNCARVIPFPSHTHNIYIKVLHIIRTVIATGGGCVCGVYNWCIASRYRAIIITCNIMLEANRSTVSC